MECHSLFSEKNKKNILNLSSAESAKRLVKVKWNIVTAVTFVCVEVLRHSQPNEVMSSAFSLPNHTFTGQA